jgi:hypothetical protein
MSTEWLNLGTRPIKKIRPAEFPDISAMLQEPTKAKRNPEMVDVMLVNLPPDGGSGLGRSTEWAGAPAKI